MFNVGDKIVYPMHGAGTIDSIEEKDILGEKQSYYILKMPSNVKVMIPTAKAEEVEEQIENKINTSFMTFRAEGVEQQSIFNKFIPFDSNDGTTNA